VRKSDLGCPNCGGYRRLELETTSGAKGEFRCLTCGELLEVFDRSRNVAIRLNNQPVKQKRVGARPSPPSASQRLAPEG
jgi:transcription initiation factor IIE alpha subunit